MAGSEEIGLTPTLTTTVFPGITMEEETQDIRAVVNNGNPFSLRALVAEGSGAEALVIAAELGKDNVLLFLIGHGANVNRQSTQNCTALIMAAAKGHVQCVDVLVKFAADVNIAEQHGWTALTMAAMNNHPACINKLTEAGADVNITDVDHKTALDTCSYKWST